jgi:hypothetical protein
LEDVLLVLIPLSRETGHRPQLSRHVSEVLATDVMGGIARLSASDMALLQVAFGDIIRIIAGSGYHGFAKCYYMRPEDEERRADGIQIDGPMRASLQVDLGESVTIVKARRPLQAEKVVVEPFLDFSPTDLDEEWLRICLEGKPLWKGAHVFVPFKQKGWHFVVISVEPEEKDTPIAATLRTEINVRNMKFTPKGNSLE